MPKTAIVSAMISTVPGSAAQSRMPDTRWATAPRRAKTGIRPERWPKTSASRTAVANPAIAVAMNTWSRAAPPAGLVAMKKSAGISLLFLGVTHHFPVEFGANRQAWPAGFVSPVMSGGPTRGALSRRGDDPVARGQRGADDRALARRGLALHRSARELDALAHPEQPEAAGARPGVEAAAVVGHDDRQLPLALGDVDAEALGVRMGDDVVQRLLHDAAEHRLEVWVQATGSATVLVGEVDAGIDLRPERIQAVDQRLDGGLDPEIVEGGRPQLGDQRAQVRDLELDLPDRCVDRLPERFLVAAAPGRAQADGKAGEALEGLVVQLARPPLAFLLGRLQGLAHPVGFDRLGVCDRRRSTCGEALEHLLVLGREAAVRARLALAGDAPGTGPRNASGASRPPGAPNPKPTKGKRR